MDNANCSAVTAMRELKPLNAMSNLCQGCRQPQIATIHLFIRKASGFTLGILYNTWRNNQKPEETYTYDFTVNK